METDEKWGMAHKRKYVWIRSHGESVGRAVFLFLLSASCAQGPDLRSQRGYGPRTPTGERRKATRRSKALLPSMTHQENLVAFESLSIYQRSELALYM